MIISYQLLLISLAPIFLWLSIKHGLNKKNTEYLWQRFGMKLPDTKATIWFHCASVGEVITASPLIKLYNETFPDKNILVTTNTITGANICKKRLPFTTHCFLPLDYRFITRRFLNKLQPEELIVLETELWPNLFQLCHSKDISINIINGRLSKRSLNTSSWTKRLYKKTLQHVEKVYCRSENDAKAYQSLGAKNKQVETIGNLKFSISLDTSVLDNLIKTPYVLAASTHSGEEKKIVEAWKKSNQNNLLLVIAPRHPERKDEILRDIEFLSDDIKIRSLQEEITDKTDIYLADTLGELSALFQHAEFVIMGGSFVSKGGHNILEPAARSKAILYGPSMENFSAEDTLFRMHNAAIQANNEQQIINSLKLLINDSEKREILGMNARKIIEKNNNIAEIYFNKLSK